MEKVKRLLYASFRALVIFWGVQMLLYVMATILVGVCEGSLSLAKMTALGYELLVLSMLTMVYYGWLNLLFLWLLYFTKINKVWVKSYWALIVEGSLFWIFFYVIREVIDALPDNLKFYYAQPLVVDDQAVAGAAYSIRLYFSDGAQLLYVYVILFLIALLVKRYGRSVFDKYVGRKD